MDQSRMDIPVFLLLMIVYPGLLFGAFMRALWSGEWGANDNN